MMYVDQKVQASSHTPLKDFSVGFPDRFARNLRSDTLHSVSPGRALLNGITLRLHCTRNGNKAPS
uniref:Uncharacterized protein n=1 Tax=Anguilla anguilla TaxID=7936 RepID=A0A0E9QFL5_ANGAN